MGLTHSVNPPWSYTAVWIRFDVLICDHSQLSNKAFLADIEIERDAGTGSGGCQ